MRNTRLLLATLLLGGAALAAGQAKQTPAPARRAAAAPASSEVKRGRQVYAEHCGVCHFSANRAKKVGPGLKGIYRRAQFASGRKVDDAGMRAWILKGGADMPAFEESLTTEQIDDLIAYLKTL